MSRLACPETFPAPARRPQLLLLAGEHSGDQQAARLVRGLREQRPDWHIAAWGGPAMEEAGAELIYDLTQAAVVGLVEVLQNYGYFRQLFDRLLAWIREHRPEAICLVDYPGLNLRLAEALRKEGLSRQGGGAIPVYYYIAPQVWAWKKKRRFRMARTLDALAVIFPFEEEVFADTSLPTTFVGHPFVAEGGESPVQEDPGGPLLLLPGSRRQAVNRILPILLAAYRTYREKTVDPVSAVILYPDESLRTLLESMLGQDEWQTIRSLVSLQRHDKKVSGSAVLTSSGTMSLRCALSGLPGRIVYRAHPVTWWIGRRIVSIAWLGMSNLLLQKPMYPEFLQGEARPGVLAGEIEAMLKDPFIREQTEADAAALRGLLQRPDGGGVVNWLLDQMAVHQPEAGRQR